jgi:branched-chain amino acid transport system substrate-binding protein
MSEGFKKGLKEFYPEAQIVGEDYHKLFATDYAPYLTKVKASGAEVIWTGAWLPDAGNLLKQARMMGVDIAIANLFLDEPNALTDVGIEGTKNLFNIKHFDLAGPAFSDPGIIKYYKAWNDAYKKWNTAPYNTPLFKHPFGTLGHWSQNFYWFLSVIERAGTTKADKIIETWEGDVYQFVNGRIVKMRPCDHRSIQGFRVAEFVPPAEQKVSFNIEPFAWYDNACNVGPSWDIPANAVLPPMDAKLDRCAPMDGWGNPKKN